MVYIDLNGRLGNNLFQVATAAALAKANNTEFQVICLNKYFNLSQYVEQFKDSFFKDVTFIYEEPAVHTDYIEKVYTYNKISYQNNILLRGWFQSEKYFRDYKEDIRHMYRMPENIKKYITDKYGHIFDLGPINSIHVRRGDYLNVPHEFIVSPLAYYKKAIKRLGENERYLIVSDDIPWCKENFKGDNYFFSDNEDALVDFYLQSFCENNIIANSTFSWWAAWLNPHPNKKVICPTRWFGIKYRKNKEHDLIPESWIQIKNTMILDDQIKALRFYWRDMSREKKREIRKKLRPVKRFYYKIFSPEKLQS